MKKLHMAAIGSLVVAAGTLLFAACKSTPAITKKWTERECYVVGWTPRFAHTSVVFKNKIWVIGGRGYDYDEDDYDVVGSSRNDVWSSKNGKDWKIATEHADFPARTGTGHTSIVFNNRMWVIGGGNYNYDDDGFFNDVWSSENGKDWKIATDDADFPARIGYTGVVFKNRMWVIGGVGFDDGLNNLNDVWSSENGKDWEIATDAADFPARLAHTSVVSNNRMWVIGGRGDGGYLNDVWSSENGKDWEIATDDADFSARSSHTGVVFKNRIWVIGGRDNSGRLNDVWSSENGKDWQDYRLVLP